MMATNNLPKKSYLVCSDINERCDIVSFSNLRLPASCNTSNPGGLWFQLSHIFDLQELVTQ